jgi:FlaA1/EpsC-like NDP-sugar epimerase
MSDNNTDQKVAGGTDVAPVEDAAINKLLRHRKVLIVAAHVGAFTVSLLFAFLLSFNMQLLRKWFVYQLPFVLIFSLPVKLEMFRRFKQYQGWWQYVGISDLIDIVKAALASTIVMMCIWFGYAAFGPESILKPLDEKVTSNIIALEKAIDTDENTVEITAMRRQLANRRGLRDIIQVGRLRQIPKQINKAKEPFHVARLQARMEELKTLQNSIEGVIMLDLFTTIMIIGGLRMFVRLYHEEYFSESKVGLKRFLIVGAGDAGEALLRELMRLKTEQFEVIGFIDDDPHKHKMSIHGIPVLGTTEQLPGICEKHKIEEVAIAMPSASHQQLRRVVQICQGTKVRFRMVPSITDIASGKLNVSQIRDVDIDDLLGREVVELDLEMIRNFLTDKVLLVTGAGGSIGSEMCRQVCQFKPKLLLLIEQAENPLFYIERELKDRFPDVPIKAIVRNITDRERIEQVFCKYKPQVVIHAAAHKHVPLMEDNPGEAIKNNIIGTMNISNAADTFGADDFVMISTDKAVNPTSIMGSSKRVAEMYIQDLNRTSKTHFVTVRFGNVLGSDGSVVPIFKKQIAAGGPITVTHPDMQRYFMTIPEASQLVLQAATLGKGGEIFVLDMGEPVKIVHLARELITLSGFRPDEDIEIVFTGTRPGEKLFEELSIEGEDMLPTSHPKIAAWKNIPKDRETLRAEIAKLIAISPTQDHDEIVALIKHLIPEYIDISQRGV